MTLVNEGLLVMDRGGRALYGNAAACDLLGYSPKELQGLTIRDTFAPEDVRFSEPQMRLLHMGEAPPTHQRRVRCRDNQIVLADVEWKLLDDGRFLMKMRPVATQRRTSGPGAAVARQTVGR